MADYLVDMGPRAGSEGGQVVYKGDYAGLLKADTLTGNHLLHKRPLKETFRQASGVLPACPALSLASHLRQAGLRLAGRPALSGRAGLAPGSEQQR